MGFPKMALGFMSLGFVGLGFGALGCGSPPPAASVPEVGRPAPAPVASERAAVGPASAVADAPVEHHAEAESSAPREAPAPEASSQAATAPAEPAPVPRRCDETATELGLSKSPTPSCYPPAAFVERLCASTHPSVALVMFLKDSPWRRGYLRGETKAWSTAPGAENERLVQDEEVLILQADASLGSSVQQDGGASFYALRWDGSCVKLTQEEMMEYAPWSKKTPMLRWGYLDEDQQATLRKDPKIDAAYLEQRKQCRAGKGSDANARCQKLEQRLSDLVVGYVRSGGELPDPAYRP